jgi:hypothetical protein
MKDMQALLKKKSILGVLFLLFFSPRFLAAEDRRTVPIDVYLIVDGSSAITNVKNDMISWLNGHVVDRLLREGDRLTIWRAAVRAEVIFSETLAAAGKETVKERIRSINLQGASADFAGALKDAAARNAAGPERRMSYTLLVSGAAGAALDRNTVNLLRYSRVEDFSGWRVLTAALGIDAQVRKAAGDYLGEGSKN